MVVFSQIDISDVNESDVLFLQKNLKRHFSDKAGLQRKDSVMGKALLCCMLKECYGITDFFVDCDDNGKPFIVNGTIHFNISHCDNRVICVCSDGEVGCDIERIREYNKKIVRRFFSAEEYKVLSESKTPDADFIRMWTLKESVLKYSGEGLSGGLDFWNFSRHYKQEKFQINGLYFICFEKDNYIISVCSLYNEVNEFDIDINKFIRIERG